MENRIEGNVGAGVMILGGRGNTVRQNQLRLNAGGPIDLGGDGPTPNDAGDVDAGPNDLANAPVVDALSTNGGSTYVTVTLDARPNATFDIDIFRNLGCDTGPGTDFEYWVLSEVVTTDASGHAEVRTGYWHWTGEDVDGLTVRPGEAVAATATDIETGDTSEYSNCSRILEGDLSLDVTGADATVNPGTGQTYVATIHNAGADVARDVTLSVGGVGQVPGAAEVTSVVPSVGACEPFTDAPFTLCRLGDLAADDTASVDVVLTPLTPGQVTAVFYADTVSYDPTLANNRYTHAFGSECSMHGTSRDDTLTGTAGDDVICLGAGDDFVDGLGGNDVIFAGRGRDRVLGGAGSDTLSGGSGNDRLLGGRGRDAASFVGADRGIRADVRVGTAVGWGTDSLDSICDLIGSTHADVLLGDPRANALRGGLGRDTLRGRSGNDSFRSRDGARDALDGGGGVDAAFRDTGLDRLDSIEDTLPSRSL
jgi:Ca2+-binding RTX toxin-like protein